MFLLLLVSFRQTHFFKEGFPFSYLNPSRLCQDVLAEHAERALDVHVPSCSAEGKPRGHCAGPQGEETAGAAGVAVL